MLSQGWFQTKMCPHNNRKSHTHTHTLLVQAAAVACECACCCHGEAPSGLRLSLVQAGHNVGLMFYSCFLSSFVCECVKLLLLFQCSNDVSCVWWTVTKHLRPGRPVALRSVKDQGTIGGAASSSSRWFSWNKSQQKFKTAQVSNGVGVLIGNMQSGHKGC